MVTLKEGGLTAAVKHLHWFSEQNLFVWFLKKIHWFCDQIFCLKFSSENQKDSFRQAELNVHDVYWTTSDWNIRNQRLIVCSEQIWLATRGWEIDKPNQKYSKSQFSVVRVSLMLRIFVGSHLVPIHSFPTPDCVFQPAEMKPLDFQKIKFNKKIGRKINGN